MSVTTAAPAKPLVTTGLTAIAGATLATSAVAAAGKFAGVGVEVGGAAIPVSGFAVLTALFSAVGLLLALALARWARRPRPVFVRATVALTALSLVPDVLADASAATKMLLMVTHLVAAAIVIPAVARRLSA
jgi:hypothetical protein